MKHLSTQEKLKKVMDRHTEFRSDLKQQVTKAEQRLREAMAVKDFAENDIIKKIRSLYAKHIREINEVLLYKEELPEAKRERLIDRRKMYLDFINMFSSADVTIESIDKWILDEFTDE